MKKIFTLSLITTLFSAGVLATAPEAKDTSKEKANEPTIYLSVFDRTNEPEPSPDLHKKEISRSKKTEKVCWVATGNFGKKATVSETFKALLITSRWFHHLIKKSIPLLIPDQPLIMVNI